MATFDRDLADDLISRYLDQSVSKAELSNLSKLLAANPQCADKMARICQLEVMLEHHFVQQRAESELLGTLSPARSRMAIAWPITLAVSTVVAFVLLGAYLWRGPAQPDQPFASQVLSGQVVIEGMAISAIPFDTPFEVGGSSAASLSLPGGGDALLEPTTKALLQRHAVSPLLHLTSGGGRFRVTTDAPIQILTPAGAVRGNDARFDVNLQETFLAREPAMPSQSLLLMTVVVLAGQVEVMGEAQPVPVTAGERRVFTPQKVPMFAGQVAEVSADGRELTIEGAPIKVNATPPRLTVEITAATELAYHGVGRGGDKPTVGYSVVATLDVNSPGQAVRVEFGTPQPSVSGIVTAVAEDSRSISVEIHRKGDEPLQRVFQLTEETRIEYRDIDSNGSRPTVGYRVEIWTKGESDQAIEVRFRFVRKKIKDPSSQASSADGQSKPNKPQAKRPPAGNDAESSVKPKANKPTPDDTQSLSPKVPSKSSKNEPVNKTKQAATNNPQLKVETKKTASPVHLSRATTHDPSPSSAKIDRLIEQRLATENIPASPLSDDGEFLRRVTLDLTGRIPTLDEALEFLDGKEPTKRQRLIDELLEREMYGQHFAEIWRELIEPRDTGSTKVARDTFSPWLAQQFNRNRSWNEIVSDLLTVEGKIRDLPQAKFILSNSNNFEPQPNLLTDSTARLFWGIQLRCAECHDHPFAPWKQSDFWSTAAFFSRLLKGYSDGKNPQGWTLTEAEPNDDVNRQFTQLLAAPNVTGPSIIVPDTGGKLANTVVKGHFLGGAHAEWTEPGPYRGRFAAWATSDEHPWFAANAVNRIWAHLFGRGLVNPLDDLRHDHPPSHPELMKLLADEFAAVDFDLKHLLRVICNTKAYQRTSRPLAENASDTECFSHMTVKVVPPGVLYDSLSTVLYPVAPKAGAGSKVSNVQPSPIPGVAREEFVRFFAARPDDNLPSITNQGIPPFLRMMNGAEMNVSAPGLNRLAESDDVGITVETMFVATYARRPQPDEKALLMDFINDSTEVDPFSGALWVLLNSSEFVLNR